MIGNNYLKQPVSARGLTRPRLLLSLKLPRFRMFKACPQDNVVLESCHGCFQVPMRIGEKR